MAGGISPTDGIGSAGISPTDGIGGAGISALPAGGGGYQGPLDLVPGALLAYSTRAMESGSTANAVRVRRSSDNAEQNFNFVNNEVDTASLSAFIDAGAGFANTWFDLAGGSYDLSQSDSTLQPGISVVGDSIQVGPRTGSPGVDVFYIPNSNGPVNPSALTLFAVCNISDNSTQDQELFSASNGDQTLNWTLFITKTTLQLSVTSSTSYLWDATGLNLVGAHIIELTIDDTGAATMLIDGVDTSATITGDPSTIMTEAIGFMYSAFYPIGVAGTDCENETNEIIIYPSVLSSPNRLAIRQNIATYYGITLP